MGKMAKNHKAEKVADKSSVAEEKVAETPVAEEKVAGQVPERKDQEPIDNTNKLFLRQFFRNPEKGNKLITKLRGKVYFPSNPNIEPGWYVATIVQEKKNYGVMDTMELDAVPTELWDPKIILGIFIKKRPDAGIKEVYRAIPKDKLETDESTPIFIFKYESNYKNQEKATTIGDVINLAVQNRMKEAAESQAEPHL